MQKVMVGIEAEFMVLGKDGQPLMLPHYIPRDDFPLLAEIRAKPGKSTAEVVGNFHQEWISIVKQIASWNKKGVPYYGDTMEVRAPLPFS